jgi:hypothetical protein
MYWKFLFFCLAVVGLVLSIIAHGAALLELPQPLGPFAWALHIGVFVVWIPACMLSARMASDVSQLSRLGESSRNHQPTMEESFPGCPAWMVWLVGSFFIYAIGNFLTFLAQAPPKGQAQGVDAPPIVFRGFSGHWMVFYSAAMAMLYSSMMMGRSRSRRSRRTCRNGHTLHRTAAYCPICGEDARSEHDNKREYDARASV